MNREIKFRGIREKTGEMSREVALQIINSLQGALEVVDANEV